MRLIERYLLRQFALSVAAVAIVLLLFDGELLHGLHTRLLGTWLIYIACALTVWSMVYYLKKALPEIRSRVQK